MTEEQKRKQKKKLDAVSDPEENQGDGNFYTHFRNNIFPQKSLSMRSVR